jgi:hypothetical protein
VNGHQAAALLDAYPHVSGCSVCRSYASEALADQTLSHAIVLSAVLGHHEGYHRGDPLQVASEHFALDAHPSLA